MGIGTAEMGPAKAEQRQTRRRGAKAKYGQVLRSLAWLSNGTAEWREAKLREAKAALRNEVRRTVP